MSIRCRAALFLVMFLAGWNDASAGPLLPSLQNYYHVWHSPIYVIAPADLGARSITLSVCMVDLDRKM